MVTLLDKQINLKQLSPDSYTASWSREWIVGVTLYGGAILAILHEVAATHLRTNKELVSKNQPDVLSMHVEMLRRCVHQDMTIHVKILRTGGISSTLQLELSQDKRIRVLALINSTNFDVSVGPTAPVSWTFDPPPKPIPDFAGLIAEKQDPNWVGSRLQSEMISFTRHFLHLTPRDGIHHRTMSEKWNILDKGTMNATFLALMADFIPSMPDQLVDTKFIYNATVRARESERYDRENPGKHHLFFISMKDAPNNPFFINSAIFDLEFKGRVPKEGHRALYTRTTSKMLLGGRQDVDSVICNDKMEIVLLARQVIFVTDPSRKFNLKKDKSSL